MDGARVHTARLDALQDIEHACWQALAQATQDRLHPWRVMTLATVDGPRADARSVVLREMDRATRSLVFFTDARSPKVAQMQAHPQATLVGWWPQPGWQLRLRVRLSVQTSGPAVSARWARVKRSPAARDYLAALPPGTPVAHVQPEPGGGEHFAVVTAQIETMDWLELHEHGHRRAHLAGEASTWLTP